MKNSPKHFDSIRVEHSFSIFFYHTNNVFCNVQCKCLVSNYINIRNFHGLKVVGCGSETLLDVGEI